MVMFVIEKMKLVSFSLFLAASPPRPKDNLTSLYKYTTCIKGVSGLGGGGERGFISERRHQSSDKN